MNDDQLTRIFKLFDCSGDGYISTREMQKISKAFGEEASLDEAEEMVEMADADCDGKVSFDEFKALMKEVDGDVPTMFFFHNFLQTFQKSAQIYLFFFHDFTTD